MCTELFFSVYFSHFSHDFDSNRDVACYIINEEAKGPAHMLPSSRHHGIGLTHYRWSPVCLLVCLSIKPAYPWGPGVLTNSYVAPYTQAYVHKHTTERLRSCVSSRGHTAHQTVVAFVTLNTRTAEPACEEG